ncbi:hypothetical protein G9C98_001623 [Cotesia typhae]|uniref:Uncharacterized protein n=1 Tax=Cotesia typhae TaxID=2053667 RepID=A0A8J5V761_9HYME|nr:hypothetical protein G9C98_001623 [Cotesia typhae]
MLSGLCSVVHVGSNIVRDHVGRSWASVSHVIRNVGVGSVDAQVVGSSPWVSGGGSVVHVGFDIVHDHVGAARQENDSINNNLSSFFDFLEINRDIFINDARRIYSNNIEYQNINDVIDKRLDTNKSQPNPECTNVILRSTSGLRLIKMIPSPECLSTCQPTAIILKAGYTLWYNWLYWRPISYPVANATEVSVNYLTSFC